MVWAQRGEESRVRRLRRGGSRQQRYSSSDPDGKYLAVKCFTKNQISKHPELTRYIRNEYEVMKALNHPNVLRP